MSPHPPGLQRPVNECTDSPVHGRNSSGPTPTCANTPRTTSSRRSRPPPPRQGVLDRYGASSLGGAVCRGTSLSAITSTLTGGGSRGCQRRSKTDPGAECTEQPIWSRLRRLDGRPASKDVRSSRPVVSDAGPTVRPDFGSLVNFPLSGCRFSRSLGLEYCACTTLDRPLLTAVQCRDPTKPLRRPRCCSILTFMWSTAPP